METVTENLFLMHILHSASTLKKKVIYLDDNMQERQHFDFT